MLPAEIGKLTALKSLDVSYNRLRELPAGIDQLTILQSLNLRSNELRELPAGIGQLKILQSLNLRNNELRALPVEIGQLMALRSLDVSHNELSILAAEMGQLMTLQLLDLSGNSASALSARIGQLTSLQSLDVSYNKLSILPVEIGQLTVLQSLNLRSNQLSTLPVGIGQLTALRSLDLSHNKLSALPAEIGHLTALKSLELRSNLLQIPPPGVIKRGIAGIFVYFRTIKIFYCYAHADRKLREQIDQHLTTLKSSQQIVTWYDRDIYPGTEWRKEIDAHLMAADIILLLISASFLDSQYCHGLEMTTALELHKKGKTHVIPILLQDVLWKDAPFVMLEMLPTKAKPITVWSNRQKALKDVAEGISKVVKTLRTGRGGLWETTE